MTTGVAADDSGRYLTFCIGAVSYAFHIQHVTEIIGMQPVTSVPDVPHFIRGVINLRGKVIPLMDVRLRLGLPEIDYHERTCIIVVDVADQAVGVIVDAVSDVLALDSKCIEPPPDVRTMEDSQYIEGVAKREDQITVLLNARRLLASGAEAA